MKTITIALLLSLLACSVSSSLRAQATFEGSIESRNTTTDELGELQHYTMKLLVKGDMVRTEISAFGTNPASTLIYRPDLRLVWILNVREKSFFEIRRTGPGEVGEGKESAGVSQIRKTGRSKKILGFPCDQLILRGGGAETEYWGTKQLSSPARSIARAFGSDPTEANRGINDQLAALGYFPMIVRSRWEGRVIEYSEVTKVDRRLLPDTLFVLPADYRRETAPQMP
jgi:hypothetical protein